MRYEHTVKAPHKQGEADQVFTRTSTSRIYTHAVLMRVEDADGDIRAYVATWCGSKQLADKAAASERNRFTRWEADKVARRADMEINRDSYSERERQSMRPQTLLACVVVPVDLVVTVLRRPYWGIVNPAGDMASRIKVGSVSWTTNAGGAILYKAPADAQRSLNIIGDDLVKAQGLTVTDVTTRVKAYAAEVNRLVASR